MTDRHELILTCPKGLEGLLLEEATALGLEEGREQTSAVRGYGALEVGYRLCLWSRLANRVLLVISRFPTVDAETLYQGVHAVDWAEHLLPSGSLAVEFSGRGSGIDNTHFGALKVKDAIVDRLRSASTLTKKNVRLTRMGPPIVMPNWCCRSSSGSALPSPSRSA